MDKIINFKLKNKNIINAEKLFNKLNFNKIYCDVGFFYFNSEYNKVVLFDLKNIEWSVYDYDTLELRGYGNELLKAILLQELELNWLTYEEYKGELDFI